MTKRASERRTALVTGAGIAAVLVAGAFAVAANVGILDASSESDIGDLAAAGDLMPTTTTTPAATVAPPTSTTTAQTYLVDVAGTVTVDVVGGALVVTAVDAAPGWTWIAGRSEPTHVELMVTDGVRSLVFSATSGGDGSVTARVDETAGDDSASATTSTVTASDDDDHDDGGYDDRQDDEAHEGRDDDD